MSALTKILIVLQLVFALVCSVLLVLMVSKQDSYKKQFDDANTARVAAVASLADTRSQIATLTGDMGRLKGETESANNQRMQAEAARVNAQSQAEADSLNQKSQIATLQANVASLTAANNTLTATNSALNDENSKIRPQVSSLTRQNSEITRALNEATNQLQAAEQAIKKLQEQQVTGASPSGAGAPMGSESQIGPMASGAAAASKVNGQIADVNTSTGSTVIGLPLGTRDGIQPNTKLFIYRGTGYVGDAVVQRATADESVAIVVSTKPGAVVQKGDLVSTISQ